MKYFTKSALGSTQGVSFAEHFRLKQQIVKIMRIGFLFTALLLITMQVLFALPVKSQKIGSVKINFEMQNETLIAALKKIEAQTPFRFVYRKGELTAVPLRTVNASTYTVEEALNLLLANTDFSFKQVENNVLILLGEDSDKSKKTVELSEYSVSLDIPIRGQVKDAKGVTLPGVSVLVKGTAIGTSTDTDGNYVINVPDGNATLVFTYIGYDTKEVNVSNQSILNVQLLESNTALSEVVVTALGIKRETKKLGYSATAIPTDQLTANRTTNIGNSIVGKVAGVNVTTPSSGPGGSSKIRIRGQSSFGGNNSPLIIVNGVPINNNAVSGGYQNAENPSGGSSDQGDGLQSINQDDIESLTVLKGAAASALYGFRAKDGVIIITTKSGTKNVGIGIDYSSNFQVATALDFTDFQYEYGQGEFGRRPTTVAEAQSSGTWSFGTKFDGQPVPQFDGSTQPYLPNKNRVRDFYEQGLEWTNSVSLNGGNDKGGFRISFANTNSGAIVPNSDYKKKILNLGLNYKFTPKLSAQLNMNYSNEFNRNPPQIGIEGFSMNTTIFTMANSIDVNWLKNYTDVNGNEMPLGRFTGRNNPYWLAYKKFENIKRDRLFGNASVKYQIKDWLYVQGRFGQDYYSRPYDFNRPTGSRNLAAPVSGFNGTYYQEVGTFKESNLDFLIGANKTLGKFGVDVSLGGNQLRQTQDRLSTSVTNFFVRDLYTVTNGQIKNPNYSFSDKRVNSFYGSADFSYSNYLYLNLTARNDWFSTLNPNSNNYLYPSASASFVFSDALKSLPSWLSFGKVRLAYAEVGGDTEPYTNNLYYSINPNNFNNSALGNISTNVSPNANLRPLKIKETEAGIDLRLFDGFLGIDFAVYRKFTYDEILDVDISIASGFNQSKVNVGQLKNEGFEMLVSLVPFNKKFKWETAFNSAYNKSEVIELAGGQTRFIVGNGQYFGSIGHEVGKPLASVLSFDYRRDAQGRVLTAAGKPLLGNLMSYGSAIPKWTGGWLNTFSYKQIRLFTQVDYKFGAVIMSNSNFNFLRHGLSKESLEGREGGALFPGFNADGSANTTRVEAEDFYSAFRNMGEKFVFDGSFVRLRTISLGYDLSKVFKKSRGMTISAVGNNVLMIKKYLPNLDPESQISVSDNFQGLDTHSLPTTRTFGLNLNVKF
jgi:TonB-linked SusC/RagA family outer membrane protein